MQLLRDIPARFVATAAVVIVDQSCPVELEIELAQESSVIYFAVIGLHQVRKKIHFKLNANTRLQSYTVIGGSGNDQIAVDYLIEHCGRTSAAYTLVKGVFSGTAHAEIFGLIKIPSSGQQTESFLEQRALLLSESARANLQPKLQIEANDLKASHAATVGQLDEGQLFYCQSRGISRQAARRLIVQGFLYDALAQLPDEALRTAISLALRQKLALI